MSIIENWKEQRGSVNLIEAKSYADAFAKRLQEALDKIEQHRDSAKTFQAVWDEAVKYKCENDTLHEKLVYEFSGDEIPSFQQGLKGSSCELLELVTAERCTQLVNIITDLHKQLASKQAKIDALMLEYCPNEMTAEQIEEWKQHQEPAAWFMVCGDWRDELVSLHDNTGHIVSGLTIEQARLLIDAHGAEEVQKAQTNIKEN